MQRQISFEFFRPYPEGSPRITVAYVRTDTTTAVGIALCSYKETPIKAKGQRIALGRALKALERGQHVSPVGRLEKIGPILHNCGFPLKKLYDLNLTYLKLPQFKGMIFNNAEFTL